MCNELCGHAGWLCQEHKDQVLQFRRMILVRKELLHKFGKCFCHEEIRCTICI